MRWMLPANCLILLVSDTGDRASNRLLGNVQSVSFLQQRLYARDAKKTNAMQALISSILSYISLESYLFLFLY